MTHITKQDDESLKAYLVRLCDTVNTEVADKCPPATEMCPAFVQCIGGSHAGPLGS